jgi:hypothetical protein
MVVAHRAMRDQVFRRTMSPSDAVTLFDAGAGQVSVKAQGHRTAIVLTNDQMAVPGW